MKRRPFQVQYSEPLRSGAPALSLDVAQEREAGWYTQCTHGDPDGAIACCESLRAGWWRYPFNFRVRNRDTGEIVWPTEDPEK